MIHRYRGRREWEGGAEGIPLLPFPLTLLTILAGCGLGCGENVSIHVKVSPESATTRQRQELVGLIERGQWDSVANYYAYQATATAWHTHLFQELFALDTPPLLLPMEIPSLMLGMSVKLLSFYPIDTARWTLLIARRLHPPTFAIYWGEENRVTAQKTVELTGTSQVSAPVVMAASPDGRVFFTWFLHDTIWSVSPESPVVQPFATLRYPSFLLRGDTSPHVVNMYWSLTRNSLYVATVSHSHHWRHNILFLLNCTHGRCTLLDTLTLPFDLPFSSVNLHGNNCLGNSGTPVLITSDTSLIVVHPYAPLLLTRLLGKPVLTDTFPLPFPPAWALYRSVDSAFASSYQLKTCGQPASEPDLSTYKQRPGFFMAIGIVRGTSSHLLYYSVCAPAPHHDTPCATYTLVSIYPHSLSPITDSNAFFVSSSRTAPLPFLGMALAPRHRSTIKAVKVKVSAPADLSCINHLQGGGDCSLLSEGRLLCFALLPASARLEQTSLTVRLEDVITSPLEMVRTLTHLTPTPRHSTLTIALFSRKM